MLSLVRMIQLWGTQGCAAKRYNFKSYKGEYVAYTCLVYETGWTFSTLSKIKEKYSLFEITHQPELCAYVTHLPVDNYQTDAAVLYKDIMTPLKPIGVECRNQE